jgi:PAS domain S-box-containing protein
MLGKITWPADLHGRLQVLQYLLPIGIFVLVAFYQTTTTVFLDPASLLHLVSDLVIYGILGPIGVFFAFEGVRQLIEGNERTQQEKMRAEEEARARERIYTTICADSADAIISLDNDSIIRSWNHGAELMFGYRAEEVVGKHFKFLVPEERQAQGELDYIREQMEERGFIRNYLTERVTKDGRRVIADLTRSLLRDEHGQVIGSSAILRDVTDRVRAEEAIRQMNRDLEMRVAERTRELAAVTEELSRRNRELEQANANLQELDRLKSEFVSMVSHELRAPLTNINGSLEILLEGNSPCTSTLHRDMLSIAVDQSRRLTRLVQGILNVSRIEAGQIELQLQAFNVFPLLERVRAGMEQSPGVSRIAWPPVTNYPSVWADRDKVEQVLLNLLDNAIKFSPDEREIRVAAEPIGDEMIISVSVQGVGIPELDRAKIFEKFHRVERDDARETYGHGLGLYICRKLVEAQGGRIWVESKLGQGSTFRFTLPLAGRRVLAREKA